MFEEGREAMKNEELGKAVKGDGSCYITELELDYDSEIELQGVKFVTKEKYDELEKQFDILKQSKIQLNTVKEEFKNGYIELKEKYEEVVEINNRMGDAYLGTLFKIDNLEKQLEKGKSNEQYRKTDPLRRRNL